MNSIENKNQTFVRLKKFYDFQSQSLDKISNPDRKLLEEELKRLQEKENLSFDETTLLELLYIVVHHLNIPVYDEPTDTLTRISSSK